MSRTKFLAAVTFWAAAGTIFAGCWDVRRSSPSSQGSSQNRNAADEELADEVNRAKDYVACRATLNAFEKDHPWFDDSDAGHDDGVAPLASFILVEPAEYADRAVGILFKSAADAATTSPPDQADIGRQFTFELPEDVLSGRYTTIDNTTVRLFRKIEP